MIVLIWCVRLTLLFAERAYLGDTVLRVPKYTTDSGLTYAPFNRVVFEIPDTELVNTGKHDDRKINIVTSVTEEVAFLYNNHDAFGTPFVEQVVRDDYKIYRKNIEKLFEQDETSFVLARTAWQTMPHYILPSYKRFSYNGNVLGEEIWLGTIYKEYKDNDGFYSPSINCWILFPVDGYLVQISIDYYNKDDTSVIEKYPALFMKTSKNTVRWASASSRNELHKILMTDPVETLPPCLYWIRMTYECIMSTLKIADYDERITSGNILKTSDNLRIRESESLSSPVIATMAKETTVKIIGRGKEELLDNITSYWAQIEVQPGSKDKDGKPIPTGTQGWCFGGYLK